jgi:hypothetical protein
VTEPNQTPARLHLKGAFPHLHTLRVIDCELSMDNHWSAPLLSHVQLWPPSIISPSYIATLRTIITACGRTSLTHLHVRHIDISVMQMMASYGCGQRLLWLEACIQGMNDDNVAKLIPAVFASLTYLNLSAGTHLPLQLWSSPVCQLSLRHLNHIEFHYIPPLWSQAQTMAMVTFTHHMMTLENHMKLNQNASSGTGIIIISSSNDNKGEATRATCGSLKMVNGVAAYQWLNSLVADDDEDNDNEGDGHDDDSNANGDDHDGGTGRNDDNDNEGDANGGSE